MISDAVTAKQQDGSARDGVEVLDISQILARSLVEKEPALVGAPAVAAVQTEDTVEASKPVGATPDATAGADQGQLAQSAGITGEGTVKDTASSGETLPAPRRRVPSRVARPTATARRRARVPSAAGPGASRVAHPAARPRAWGVGPPQLPKPEA